MELKRHCEVGCRCTTCRRPYGCRKRPCGKDRDCYKHI